MIVLLSLVLFFLGWYYFKLFYVKKRRFFIPYIIFQLGVTLLVISIFLIGGFEGMGYGVMALMIMAMGLLLGLIFFLYFFIKEKRMQNS